jgi:hypothetical protein
LAGLDRADGEDVAEEHRSGVAHEDRRWAEVIDQEAHGRSAQRGHEKDHDRIRTGGGEDEGAGTAPNLSFGRTITFHLADLFAVPIRGLWDDGKAARTRGDFKDPKLWTGLKLVIDTRNMIEPLFKDGGQGPERLVKA